jgi:hypothetical protein
LWGHGLKQRETRGIKILQKLADFCGFFKDFGATPAGVLVPGRGLEPPRPCERQHLKLVRLPIPPSGHMMRGAGAFYGVPSIG